MENNGRKNEGNLDLVPQPTIESLEDVDVYNGIDQAMETEDDYHLFVEEQKDDEQQYDSDHDIDKEPTTENHTNENYEDISVEYDEDEELCTEYMGEVSESEKKHDPLIVQGNDGMIKKIKICNTLKDVSDKTEIKTKKISNIAQIEGNINNKLQPRSSTPMSREYLALQRSVNESKILTEFVTDAASEKPRKLRAKDSANSLISSTADHSYSSIKKSNQLSPVKVSSDDIYTSISPSQTKRQHGKRYAPLKDSDSDPDSSSVLRSRSRSKSMHNSEFNSSGTHRKLKKWPSEERLHKRTNMRSENTEFAQKQMDFLQRVIHACENTRSRSRSRSCGRKTPNSLNEPSFTGGGGGGGGGGSGVAVQQQKPHKSGSSSSKDRSAKRNKYDISSENEEQILAETTSEQPDDESVNESQASLMGINSTADNTLADYNEVESHFKSSWQPSPKPGYDSFCWKCHKNKVNLCCCKCIRSFHASCVKINKFDNIWLCPECTTVESFLNNPKRSRRNELSLDLLSQLLSFALKRMRYTKGHYSFVMPYEESTIYKKYIANPVTLTGLQAKIEAKEFRCAEEFVNETKWMLHNACILSSLINTKVVLAAKSIFKICRQEANEIETCAECYLNANTRTDWFVDVCSHPHLLLWAKLKGFPYWPAKAMGLGQNSLINVRFFGEHDRAFVPLKDCFLYSEQDPNTATGKRAARELADCIKEVEEHIEKIRTKVGGFKYATFKTPYDPAEEMKQLAEMMPGVEDFIKKQQVMVIKPSLQFKIYKTADNHLSIVQKASTTPELPSSTHENEEKEKERKKKLCSESNDSKKLEELTTPPAKYEVVSKVSSDDSNSSKLSTVILKRKSANGDSKKASDDEPVEFPLPKMTKIEEPPVEEDMNNLNGKRKLEIPNNEKPKAKHNKLEPKIPIMTIKTSVAKMLSETLNNQTNSKTFQDSKTNENNETTNQHANESQQQNETNEGTTSETQNVMDNFVKHKQGVTIKKIFKDFPNSNCAEQSTSTTSKEECQKERSQDKKQTKQKNEDEKARENQKVNNILKGLVPFVEVKKELSDNEDDVEKQQNEKSTDKETNTQTNKNNNEDLQKVPEKPIESLQANANNNATESNSAEKSTGKEDDTEMIVQVKQEVLSDEDETNENKNSNTSAKQTTIVSDPLHTGINNNSSSCSAEKQATTTTSNDIRVIGDTTIQKLPNKHNQSQHLAYGTSTGSNNISSNISYTNNNSNNNNTKRSSLKGVPYGPLPASAFPKTVTSKSFHLSEVGVQPRAKKSFPQNSPPVEKLRPNTNQNTLTQMSPPTTSQHLDQKRIMAKNTMVTIPVDVAVNRASSSAGTIIIGNIPVPPLTAVSKTIPSSLALNSTARNSPATITVSGASSSLATPPVMVQVKTSTSLAITTCTTVRNSPTTVISSSSLLVPLTTTSSVTSTPITTTTTTFNPLTMTTPPPLAGLSNSKLITTPQTNGVSDTNNTTIISSSPAANQQSSTETHILGGLVTPTLASAITDVICRGPPKLAARPSGPLQSEGYPMFPSQAGPVCKRLVENVHKLTDFFISVVEDTMGEMAQGDEASLQAKNTLLTMELERCKQAYEQEITELKRTSDLMLCEMRKSMENEKTRLVVEIRKQCEMERLRSVEETKRKQWCANCFREANFYCCWNTSYCDYPCQQLHWSRHSHSCAQTRPAIHETTNSASSTTQTERHHSNKSNNTITLNSTVNSNKSASTSQKKEKGVTKNATNHMISSSITTAPPASSASRSNTEVLKLPTNTFLRPVTSNLNNQTLRCNTTYSIPIQRFNAPLPITTPANTNSPQTYTIVQQGNNWVMSSTTNNNSNNSNNTLATNSSTIAAPAASVPQATVHTRSAGSTVGSVIASKTAKTQIRYH